MIGGERIRTSEIPEDLVFTIQSSPTDGPAPDAVREGWVGMSFSIQRSDIKIIKPHDPEREPYAVVAIPLVTAVQRLAAEGKVAAADFWLKHALLNNKDENMPLYFNAECGQFFEPVEISVEMIDAMPYAERIHRQSDI